MNAKKLAFRFQRNSYSDETWITTNTQVKLEIQQLFGRQEIKKLRIYSPSRNSIKVIFPTDTELNKVFEHKNEFSLAGYTPTLSMSLKAERTVFCSGLVSSLFTTHSKEQMKSELIAKGWEVEEIYLMQSNLSIKIEMKSTAQATKFIENINTQIGGVTLQQEHKEREVDPYIQQCWKCGIINPNHNSRTCHSQQICLKCGDTKHKFYECSIPKRFEDMSERHKALRYCVPCGTTGSHSSLDHTRCPTKRKIRLDRVREIREKRQDEIKDKKRDLHLIKSVFDYSNTEAWPLPQGNTQQIKTTAIISLSLLEEYSNPGSFQNRLNQACKDNGLPEIKYSPSTNMVRDFWQAASGSERRTQPNEPPVQQLFRAPSLPHLHQKPSTQAPHAATSQYTHFFRDSMGGKKFVNSNIDMVSMEQPEYSESQNKKDRRPTPYKIQVRTQTQNISLDNTYTHQKPNVGTTQTPESLRDISQTSNSLNLNESYHLLDDSLSPIAHGSSDDNQYSLSGQDISQHSQGAAAITTSTDNTSHTKKYPKYIW